MSTPPRPFSEADAHAYADGQMDLERRAAFTLALAADPDAKAKVDAWRQQNSAITAAFGPILTEPVPPRLLPANLGRTAPPANPRGEPIRDAGAGWRPVLSYATLGALAFAAGGLAMLGAGAAGILPPSAAASKLAAPAAPVPQRAFPIRAYEAHQTYVTDLNHAVEVNAADQAHLLKWMQHRMSMPVRIPDLRREGWTLLGGRILPGELGPAAFLIYVNGIDRMGLYISRTNAHGTDSPSLYDNGAGLVTVAYWIDEPVGYAITTSRDTTWLDRNDDALIKTIRAQAKDSASAQ